MVEVYCLDAVSGKTIKEKPEAKRRLHAPSNPSGGNCGNWATQRQGLIAANSSKHAGNSAYRVAREC